MVLLNSRGQPLDTSEYKKQAVVKEPRSGAFGQWAGRDEQFLTMPGGGVMQFDLSRLTLADYRSMRQHYQLGSSLNVLSFVMHQIDWHIDCENKEMKDLITEELHLNWTPFIRSISQAFWAGYSPIAVNYENRDSYTRIEKFKDLIPEECRVEWKKTKGWAPEGKVKPTIWEYNGLNQGGFWIPPENTLWYPLLMENGDYYGRKLLRSAFPSWFFSNLIHLFSNRYFERFGEPLPIGRGRFDDQLDMGDGVMLSGKRAMEKVVQGIRNRAVVVLPSDRDPMTKEYDYNIEYLESQMRGADFERYLSRLDEEMSLAVFTPVLLFRTADVGSYNLGQAHLRIFQQMLNAISGDLQYYIQNYLVNRLKVLNFPGSEKVKCNWEFRAQGNADVETYKEILVELVRQNKAGFDMVELGRIAGLDMHEVKEIVEPPPDPAPVVDPKAEPKAKPKVKAGRQVLAEAATRVAREVGSGKVPTALGYRNKLLSALDLDEFDSAAAIKFANDLYAKMNTIIAQAAPVVEGADEMKAILDKAIDLELAAYHA